MLNEGKLIGVSPAGVEWIDYRGQGGLMRRNLIAHWRRVERVRVRKLTPAQVDLLEDVNGLWAEAQRIPEEVADYGKTFVEAPREMLQAALERLESEEVEVDPFELGEGYRAPTDAQVEFVRRAREQGLRSTVSKLRKSLDED